LSLRQNARLPQEQYSHRNEFNAELNMSYTEFYEELKKEMGCTPITWHLVN